MSKEKGNVKQYWPVVCSALFLAFTICLYAPVEIYITNRVEFWFRLGTFVWMPICFFVVAFLVMAVVGILLNRFKVLSNIYTGALFGAAVCIYCQANFFNLAVGAMNGRDIDWSIYKKEMMVNLLIWAVIFIVIMVLTVLKSGFMKKAAQYISLLLIATQTVALVTMVTPLIASGEAKAGLYSTVTDEGLFEVGDGENIIVLVIDSYDAIFFDYVVENCPEILAELNGFTYFDNFSGAAPNTLYGLLPLVDGEMFLNQYDFDTWVANLDAGRMYYDELHDAGYDIDMYEEDARVIPERLKEMSDNIEQTPLKFNDNFSFFKHLYRMVACKYMPNIAKKYLWLHGDEFSGTAYSEEAGNVFCGNNNIFIDGIENGGLSVKKGTKTYKFIHLMGAHLAFGLDEMGNFYPQGHTDENVIAKGTIRMTIKYLDELKRLGVYDQSNIVIVSDHGFYDEDGRITNSIMLAKRAGETGDFKINHAPTWPNDFAATLVDMAGSENKSLYGTSVYDVPEDKDRERYHYQYIFGYSNDHLALHNDRNVNIVEYKVPFDSDNTYDFELTGKEICWNGEIIEHEKYCSTCLEGTGPDPSKDEFTIRHQATKDHPHGCDSKNWGD